MSSPFSERETRTRQLAAELRRMAGETVLYHQAIAERVGLAATDLRCLELLAGAGALTAGRLAEFTGLSTSTITAAIDRLERAGYARRARDPRDRRKVLVEPVLEAAERDLLPLFAGMGQAMDALCAEYDDAELALITEFARRCVDLTRVELERLRRRPSTG